jgi:D-3-phosphoglycerate dehydrogenase
VRHFSRKFRQETGIEESNQGYEWKTVGIIVWQLMGKAFAKKLRGFSREVVCYDIAENVGDASAITVARGIPIKVDVLSLHIPWTTETDKMVNTTFINGFAKFWIINTSRGKNSVTADLVAAEIWQNTEQG